MKKSFFLFAVVLLISGAAFAGQPGVHQMKGLQPAVQFDRAAYDAEQERLHAWLVAEQVEAGLVSPATIKLTEQEILEIESGRCEDCQQSANRALLAGLVKPVEMDFELDDFSHGAIGRTEDGLFVWTAALQSDHAAGLRIFFSDFSMPAGYELWLYSEGGIVRGPYTAQGPNGSGDFWSHTIAGSTAILQLRGRAITAADGRPSFTISDLGHIGQAANLKAFCSFNADCVVNAACQSHSAVSDAESAIAHMRYVKRPYIYMCSGGLLNSSINEGAPYFLTANHCISRDREAETLETYFNFTTTCGGDCDLTDSPSTLGSTVLVTNSTSDFTLLQLSGNLPSTVGFLGWTSAPVVDTGASLYRISHPGGAPQAYSQHNEWVPPVVCSSWDRGNWIYTQDQIGATEGGSSGSPVVNDAGLVVGQLSGGCGSDVYNTCNNVDNSTVDGAFAAYYDQVAPWLGSGEPCTDDDNDGYCVPTDCDDSDAAINPDAEEICDGADNNCDGTVDEGCGGCTDDDNDGWCVEDGDCEDDNPFVNPGVPEDCDNLIDDNCDGTVNEGCVGCGEVGDPCTSGADCCSLRCHPRKLTCK